MQKLKINIVDGCELEFDNSILPISSKKSRAIAGYLICTQQGKVARGQLCGLLWSEFEDKKSRTSLRQALKLLNQHLEKSGCEALKAGREFLSLDNLSVLSDLDEVWQAIERGDFTHPLLLRERFTETLFSGFEDLDQAFSNWLTIYRESVFQSLINRLQIEFERSDNIEMRLEIARALAKADPTNETIIRFIIQTEIHHGNKQVALREFKRLEHELQTEFDVDVEEQTRALVRSIQEQQNEIKTENLYSAATRLHPININAEMPKIWVAISENQSKSTLDHAEAISAMTTGNLSRFRFWKIAKFSSDTFRIADKSEPDGQYKLTIELISTEENWCISFCLSSLSAPETVIASQSSTISAYTPVLKFEELVRMLCGALSLQFSHGQMSRIRAGEAVDGTLFEKLLEIQSLSQSWSPEADRQAELMILEAIHQYPNQGELHARLADIYNSRHITFPGFARDAQREYKSLQLAKRAVLLDPLSSRCHLTMAWSQALNNKHEQAAYSFENAVELNPNDAESIISAAHGIAICGSPDRAIDVLSNFLDDKSRLPNVFWGIASHVHFMAENFEHAVELAEKSGEVKPNILAWKCAALAAIGQYQKAKHTADEFIYTIELNWLADIEPSRNTIAQWFLNIFPYGKPKYRQKMVESLSKAGLIIES